MAKSKKLIPFWMWPFSWGMAGKTREIAKAEYELEGIELENKLSEIKFEGDDTAIRLAALEARFKHDKINEDDYEKQKAELLKQPWVKITNKPNLLNNGKTIVGIDYNDYFIKYLEENGYGNITEEDAMIEAYLNDTYIAILEELHGLDIDTITPTHRSDELEEE